MRVLICGGRDYADVRAVHEALNALPVTVVIHGNATGADALAESWAESRCVQVDAYPADWFTHGRAAGPRRNARMLAEGKPDLVLAFPGGRGTADMVRRARCWRRGAGGERWVRQPTEARP